MKVAELVKEFTGDRVDFRTEDDAIICTCPADSYVLSVLADKEVISWKTIASSRKSGISIVISAEDVPGGNTDEEVTEDVGTETT